MKLASLLKVVFISSAWVMLGRRGKCSPVSCSDQNLSAHHSEKDDLVEAKEIKYNILVAVEVEVMLGYCQNPNSTISSRM